MNALRVHVLSKNHVDQTLIPEWPSRSFFDKNKKSWDSFFDRSQTLNLSFIWRHVFATEFQSIRIEHLPIQVANTNCWKKKRTFFIRKIVQTKPRPPAAILKETASCGLAVHGNVSWSSQKEGSAMVKGGVLNGPTFWRETDRFVFSLLRIMIPFDEIFSPIAARMTSYVTRKTSTGYIQLAVHILQRSTELIRIYYDSKNESSSIFWI